ncbi:hypothetical protein [Gordonia neofelifaecis]|uniref:Lipoprotein n=1 Tax=Gordonia neofelifaecis NRRL B-59395 TaxID=644548 RepID=F1YJR9_9ACTN|nr:hypothetical protein [Gordonia neofelifaecis]EGD55001.1 hypothetical protein SCNU_10746 [Gordonia neofelifaecis NRRL B-59395]
MKDFRRLLAAALIMVCASTFLMACGSDDEPTRPGVALPSDFPESDVPLVDGAVLTASGESPKWQVTVQAKASDGNALTNAVTELTDAGFEESSRVDDPQSKSVLLSKDVDGKQIWVNVGSSPTASAGASTLIYQVTVAG